MTSTKDRAAITSALRRVWRTSLGYREALEAAKEEYTVPSKHGSPMRRVHFACKECLCYFQREAVHVDHVDPVVDPVAGFLGWDQFIDRLFYGPQQVLCTACHDAKTTRERDQRTLARRAAKAIAFQK
jgi:hypothetical protein